MTNTDRIYRAHAQGKLKAKPQRYIDIVERIGAALDESGLFVSDATFNDNEIVLVHDLIAASLVYLKPSCTGDSKRLCVSYGLFNQKWLRVDETFDLDAQAAELIELRKRVAELEEQVAERFTMALAN